MRCRSQIRFVGSIKYGDAIDSVPCVVKVFTLSTYAKTCGAQETVTHVLVDCPNLGGIRRKLRSEAGDAFSSASSLLGGSTEGKRGKPDAVSRPRTAKAVLDFAEASQRFRSRAL